MTELSHVAFPESRFPEGEYLSSNEELSTHLVLRACERYLSWRDTDFDQSKPLSMPDYIPDLESLPAAPPEYATETADHAKLVDSTFGHLSVPDQQYIDNVKTIKVFGKPRPGMTDGEKIIRRRAAIVGHVIDRLSLLPRN